MKNLFQIFAIAILMLGLRQGAFASEEMSEVLVQVYDGRDDNKSACTVEVLGYTEEVDPNVNLEDLRGVAGRTNVKKTLQFRVSFQYNANDVFTATSLYDTMWDAYDTTYLLASNEIEENRFERLKLFLKPGSSSPRSVDYYRDAKVTVFGIEFGEVENSCRDLKLREDGK